MRRTPVLCSYPKQDSNTKNVLFFSTIYVGYSYFLINKLTNFLKYTQYFGNIPLGPQILIFV